MNEINDSKCRGSTAENTKDYGSKASINNDHRIVRMSSSFNVFAQDTSLSEEDMLSKMGSKSGHSEQREAIENKN